MRHEFCPQPGGSSKTTKCHSFNPDITAVGLFTGDNILCPVPDHVSEVIVSQNIQPVVATDTAVALALTDDEDMLKAVHELSRSIF